MSLAFLGFAMIVVFMALIMAKKIKSVHIIDTGADCLRTAGRLWMGYA